MQPAVQTESSLCSVPGALHHKLPLLVAASLFAVLWAAVFPKEQLNNKIIACFVKARNVYVFGRCHLFLVLVDAQYTERVMTDAPSVAVYWWCINQKMLMRP